MALGRFEVKVLPVGQAMCSLVLGFDSEEEGNLIFLGMFDCGTSLNDSTARGSIMQSIKTQMEERAKNKIHWPDGRMISKLKYYLDIIVISHADEDHVNMIDSIFGEMQRPIQYRRHEREPGSYIYTSATTRNFIAEETSDYQIQKNIDFVYEGKCGTYKEIIYWIKQELRVTHTMTFDTGRVIFDSSQFSGVQTKTFTLSRPQEPHKIPVRISYSIEYCDNFDLSVVGAQELRLTFEYDTQKTEFRFEILKGFFKNSAGTMEAALNINYSISSSSGLDCDNVFFRADILQFDCSVNISNTLTLLNTLLAMLRDNKEFISFCKSRALITTQYSINFYDCLREQAVELWGIYSSMSKMGNSLSIGFEDFTDPTNVASYLQTLVHNRVGDPGSEPDNMIIIDKFVFGGNYLYLQNRDVVDRVNNLGTNAKYKRFMQLYVLSSSIYETDLEKNRFEFIGASNLDVHVQPFGDMETDFKGKSLYKDEHFFKLIPLASTDNSTSLLSSIVVDGVIDGSAVAVFPGDPTYHTMFYTNEYADSSFKESKLMSAPHHGSIRTAKYSDNNPCLEVLEIYLRNLNPERIIISAGYNSMHGHPHVTSLLIYDHYFKSKNLIATKHLCYFNATDNNSNKRFLLSHTTTPIYTSVSAKKDERIPKYVTFRLRETELGYGLHVEPTDVYLESNCLPCCQDFDTRKPYPPQPPPRLVMPIVGPFVDENPTEK